MGFESQNIPSLLNGVSQQPAVLRHPTQAEAQENCLSSLSEGLGKRPPFRFLKSISVDDDSFVHYFENTRNNVAGVFAAVFRAGALNVYNIGASSATEMTLNTADHTVSFLSAVAATGRGDNPLAIPLWVAATTTIGYTVTITGTATVTVNTYDAEGVEQATLATLTSTGTGNLATSWTTADNGLHIGVDVTVFSSGTVTISLDLDPLMYIPTAPKTNLRASSVADYTFVANQKMLVQMTPIADGGSISGSKQTFGNLSAPSGSGAIWRIQGDESTDFDDYYVQDNTTTSVWTETALPGEVNSLVNATMPFALTRVDDTTFAWGAQVWNSRIAGDATSAPEPNFVENYINDIVFYRDRLGFIAGEGATLSRVGTAPGGYFAFFPESVQHVLATDPIDVKATKNDGGNLHAGVVFNEDLLLFTNKSQFIMSPTGVLTPETARVDPTTAFAASTALHPIDTGNNVYFSINAGSFEQIREYFVTGDANVNDAADITAHVPEYIPAGLYQIAGTTSRDMLVALTTGDPDALYIYKFFWEGDEKRQSSWSRWTIPSHLTIVNVGLLSDRIQLVVADTNNAGTGYILQASFGTTVLSIKDVPVHLDLLHAAGSSYSAATDLTTLTFSYSVDEADFANLVAVVKDTDANAGLVLGMTRVTGATATVIGDVTGYDDIYVGHKFEQRYQFSEQFIKRETGTASGKSAVSQLVGRLQLRRFYVHYKDTGVFTARVALTGRPTDADYVFDANTTGVSAPGELYLASGTFSFGVFARSTDATITLVNDSWTPATFLSAEWVGLFSSRPVRPGRTITRQA